MARLYRIRDGHSFRVDDATVKGGGEIIELEDDVAALHASKVDPAPLNDGADEADPVQEH